MENTIPIHTIIQNISSKGAEFSKETKEWLESSKANKQVYQELKTLWQLTGTFPTHFAPNKSIAWDIVKKQVRAKKRKIVLYRRITQVAAAVIIIFLSSWIGYELNNFKQPTYSEIISPTGQKNRVILPDSSVVMLNGDSRIRYRSSFTGNSRDVELTGEGFFEVRKDKSRPFFVHTSEIDVKVFGTSFNVKAYKNENIEIGLKSGKVGIGYHGHEIAQLIPGQLATYAKNIKKLNIREMNIDLVSSWTRNEMIFEENTLDEIVKYIERWYGVTIDISPELLDSEKFTFKVKTESLQELLKLINMLKPIQYKIDGNKVQISK